MRDDAWDEIVEALKVFSPKILMGADLARLDTSLYVRVAKGRVKKVSTRPTKTDKAAKARLSQDVRDRGGSHV